MVVLSSQSLSPLITPTCFTTELEVLSVQFSSTEPALDYIYGTIILRASGVDYVIFNRKVEGPPVIHSDGRLMFNPSDRFIRMTDDITMYVFLFELERFGMVHEIHQVLLWSTGHNPNYDGVVFLKNTWDHFFGQINVKFRAHKRSEYAQVTPYKKVVWKLQSPLLPLAPSVWHRPPSPHSPNTYYHPDFQIDVNEVAMWGPEYVYLGARQLADIFSVRFLDFKKSEADQIYGAIILRASGLPYVVFHRTIEDAEVLDSEGTVKLVGPDRCIEVHDYLTMNMCLFDWILSKFYLRERDTLWFDPENKLKYGKIMVKEVESDFGPIELRYAVYERAAEGVLSVILENWNAEGENANMAVHEEVYAWNKDFQEHSVARIYLFDVKGEEVVRFECADAIPLPLTRSTIVMPLACSYFPDSKSAFLDFSVCLYKNDLKVFDDAVLFSPLMHGTSQATLSPKYNTSTVVVKVK